MCGQGSCHTHISLTCPGRFPLAGRSRNQHRTQHRNRRQAAEVRGQPTASAVLSHFRTAEFTVTGEPRVSPSGLTPRSATSPPAQALRPQVLPRTRWGHPRMVPGRPVPRSHPCCFSDRSAAASPADLQSSPGVCQQLFLSPLRQHLSSPSPRRKQDGPLG